MSVTEPEDPVIYSLVIYESGRMVVHNGGDGMPMVDYLRKMIAEIEQGDLDPRRIS